jgi:hypothetical protein
VDQLHWLAAGQGLHVNVLSFPRGLEAGHAVHLDLSAGNLRDERGNRHELRAFAAVTTRDGSQLPPDVCKPSVETYNEFTGGTKFYSSPPDPDLPAPQ